MEHFGHYVQRVIWRREIIAEQWREAEGIWIPKEENSTKLEHFRSISLLSVEGKIFFSILARRMTDFLLKNGYIDTSVQKGAIPGVAGCLGHTGVVTQLIRKAREGNGNLAVLWLDLANAYGSIPHKLVETTLDWHHVPFKIKGLIMDYYSNFSLRVTSGSIASNWHRLEIGKVFDCSLRDTASIQTTIKKLEAWLSAVDKSGLPGRFKAWIYQHGILPRILWPLLVYEVSMSTVEALERKISCHIRRWLGLPRSLTSVALYGRSNKLQLPFSNLEEEFRVSRIREALLLNRRTGRKWRAQEGLELAESRLRYKALVGIVATGRAGLGAIPKPQYNKAQGKVRRELVLEEVRAGVEEVRTSRAVSMRQQGAWTRWEGALERKITWNDIWKAEPQRIKFLVQAVYDVLPGPTNLHVWGKSEVPTCPLCPRRGSLEHILSSCPTSASSKQILLLELSVPWEDRMEEANERKRLKYQELIEDCRRRGWKACCEPIEVGCRGYAARSLCKIFARLGITGAAKRRAIKSITEAAERALRWIWIKRSAKWASAAETQVGA
ncbi:uncharacterized protein LOC120514312 [Polypterus senegalus]|uniref:uncharacterized protein LOC120514312 n=1 Tax=Polypterus senegalus TaxID=55291 RepID=UPI0019631873|nr:uncharacterized protein LOC120514312 [Polypterus senegalus]